MRLYVRPSSVFAPAGLLVLHLFGATSATATVGTCESLPGGVIEVEGTGGSGTQPTGYGTLGGAFTAINGGVHTGTIVVDVCGNTAEAAASSILNASGSGAAVYTSILISPAGGAARTITAATTAGLAMIDFNGADNVTIDGLNTGGNSLTISNTTVSATSGTSTIRFQADATNNLLTNTSILGSATMAPGTNGGNVFFGSAAIATGNDNNTVSNCNIGPAGANLPTKGIYFSGSSNTDPGTANSGITINGNNIFDYFSPTVSSAGIDLNSGTVGTTISNNRFFQTASRTMTSTGLTHSGIRLSNTSGNAFQITGNTVGFASNTGTGTYTLTFPTTTTGAFVPFNIAVNTITVTNINGNTVAGIAVSGGASGTSTGAPFRGIYVSAGLAVANNNTIGSQSATGSITYTSTSTAASDVIGIFNFGSSNWTTNGNTIGGITAANSSTGASNVYGLRTNTASGVTWTCSNNTIGGTVASSMQSTTTAAGTTVQGIKNDNPIGTFTGNTIRNLTAGGGTGTTTAASVIGIAITTTASNQTVSQNTIFGLSNTNTIAATIVTGIQFTGSTANVVQRNLIHGLTSATTSATAEVNGIRVGGGTTVYRNNMIAIGAGIANAIGSAPTNGGTTGVNGINEFLGTNSFFHNSVYIGGTATAGTGTSYAFNGTQTINTRSFRDNIFHNARSNSGATGSHYAVKINGTAPNPAGLTLNNNVYFANGAVGALFGFYNSANVANLGAWKIAVGQDSASIEGNPAYNDPTNAPPDLHIHPTTASVAEGNGVDLGVTDDFDGQTRSGLTPVDIGADAGNFNGVDLTAPAITYTPFTSTASTANRLLTATITDSTGVATGGLAPRIYYRKNAGAYFSQGCSLASGTVNNGNWDCTINNADVGGVGISDVINYFVIAQDTLSQIASNPAGAVATNVNTVTTPPAAPNSYTILQGLSGTLDIGTTEPITSLTNPSGFFEFLNNFAVLTGNLNVNIATNLLIETGTHALNPWLEDGVGGYTLTIRPAGGVPKTISGSNTTALINLNGADRVIFDGFNTGGNSLLVRNTSATTGAVFQLTNDASNDQLRNMTIEGGNTNTSSALVLLAAGTTTGNDNNTISDNVIRARTDVVGVPANLVASLNASTTALNSNNTVSGNQLANFTANGFATSAGATSNNWTVTNNDVSQNATRAGNVFGFNTGGMAGTNLISGNSIHGFVSSGTSAILGFLVGNSLNLTISGNRIYDFQTTAGATGVIEGIEFDGASGGAANVTVVNNMVTLAPTLATAQSVIGIQDFAFGGNTFTANYNSIYIGGTATGASPSWALKRGSAAPTTYTARNNVAFNNRTGGTSSHFGGGDDSANTGTFVSNFNFYAGTGAPTALNFMDYGTAATGTPVSFGAWTTGPPTRDANSVAGLASSFTVSNLFVDVANGDLHLVPAAPLGGLGTPVAGVTTDFDNDPRHPTTPTIGADELLADLSITKTDGVTSAAPGGSTTYTITASNAGPANTTGTVNDTFPAGLTCTWNCVGAGGGTCTAAGAGNISDAVTLPVFGSVTYTASCSISVLATGALVNTATVTGVAGDPVPANNSATDTDTLVPEANLGITKTDGITNATPGSGTTYTITASNAGPSNTTGTVVDNFPGTLSCNWTCSGAGGGLCTAAGSGNINDPVTLPVGGSVAYIASCSIASSATGTLTNTASVTGAAFDPTTPNNATDVDNLSPSANAGITKTDGVTTVTPGGSATYTITASNAGPSDTTATVTDTFPASLTCNWTCVGAGGGLCTAAGSGSISEGITLPAGGSVTYTASCSIAPSATGSLSNTAFVTSAATDPVPGNDSANDTDTLTPQADVAITKTDGVSNATPGGSTTYTITASNGGPSNTTATVADTFPASLTCTWTCSGTLGGTCTGAGAGPISDPSVTLPAGATVSYIASCSISPSATGTLSNTATVAGAATDPVAGNNSSTDNDNLVAEADISVSKTVNNPTPAVSTNVIFTVTASNAGPSDATGVEVNDVLPVGLSFVSAVASSGSYNSGSGDWTIGALANGASATLTITATVTRPQTQINAASKSAAGEADARGSNNTAVAPINAPASIDIQVSQTVDDTTPAASQNVVFLVTARNAGPSTATLVDLTDNLPPGLSFVSSAPSQGSYTPGSGLWGVGTLASGASATLSVTMTNTGSGTVTRTVSKTAATEEDPVTGNDAASVTLNPLQPVVDMALTKITTQEPVASGLNFRYAIAVTNLGPDNATGVTVTDTLPAGVTLVLASTSQGSCSGVSTVTCSIGNLLAGGSASVDLLVTKTTGGQVSNTATVAANENDPNPANNSNVTSTTPVTLLEFEVD